ncbi:MAG: SAM-dependent methyltransferase [Spiribacter salinus]|uniref:SAM-dependent methyltransferase n=1 Tax=Spiribacter salinus TaxID=1335746 RepID=A0A540VST3_9GAMM|nr:MAG: SAM-dependent methyltransferase [Spiribacter salinus]
MTALPTDYLDAHQRHWSDAEHLLADSRLPNADQLFGFSAECGLKRLMLVFGMKVDPSTDSPEKGKDRKHVDRIWSRFETYRSGHPAGAKYTLPTTNSFSDWSASQRYAEGASIALPRVQAHQSAAQKVRQLIKQAQKDGLL